MARGTHLKSIQGGRAEPRERFSTGRPMLSDTDDATAIRDAVLEGLLRSRKDYESKVVDETNNDVQSFTPASGGVQIEAPPYNLAALAALVDRSNTLRQCFDAYVANIESTGYSLVYIGPEDGEESDEALAEKSRITDMMDDPNGEYSFIEMRERNRRDRESIGAYVVEVVRTSVDNSIRAIYHMPAHTIYLSKRDAVDTPVVRWIKRGGAPTAITRNVKFRRIIQVIAGKKTFFKEFGDPRPIDPQTGKVNAALAPEAQATELLYVPEYKSGFTYGVPRYIHQLPSILGSREAELTNLSFFKNNAVPAMVVTLSGGALTKEAFADVQAFFNQSRGRDAQHRVLVIESQADAASGSQKGVLQPPKLDIKPLGNERQQDGLFQEYDKANQTKVRSAFRLGSIYVGMSEDVNYASAQASLQLSETQVFGPERAKVDEVINTKLLQDAEGKAPQYWWVKSNQPRLVDPNAIQAAIPNLESSGAMTPNIAITIANEMFGLEIPPIVEPWGDIPFTATQALMSKGPVVGWEDVIGEPYPPPPSPFGAGPPPGDGVDVDENGNITDTPPGGKAKPKPNADGETPDAPADGEEPPETKARTRVRLAAPVTRQRVRIKVAA